MKGPRKRISMVFISTLGKGGTTMADQTLVMSFLNQEGSRTSISLPAVRPDITEAEVSAAMDVIIAQNIFYSNGGDLVSKYSAQMVERNVTDLAVK
jgi:hypothetical protein